MPGCLYCFECLFYMHFHWISCIFIPWVLKFLKALCYFQFSMYFWLIFIKYWREIIYCRRFCVHMCVFICVRVFMSVFYHAECRKDFKSYMEKRPSFALCFVIMLTISVVWNLCTEWLVKFIQLKLLGIRFQRANTERTWVINLKR